MIKIMIYYFRQAQTLSLALALLLLQTSCDPSSDGPKALSTPTAVEECKPDSIPPPRAAFTIQEGDIVRIATEVGKGVGKVIAAGQGSKNRTLFIFEETHDSRIGQLEIALMLWRLQKHQGLRQVSLEGAFVAKGALPAKWFHDLTGGTVQQSGWETALRLLLEGEISAAEFIALVQPAVQVKGNEIESEYSVEASKSNAALGYLISIAEKSLAASDAQRVNELAKAKKIDEALDVIFSKDSWAKERYQKLYGKIITSTEESTAILREIETKARALGVRIEAQQEAGFREDLNFYQMASKRSCTIVKNTLAMMDAESTAPVALLIGAAHTPKVIELIKAAQVNYVVLSPLSLVTPTEAGKLTGQTYIRKSNLKSVDEEGMLGTLLAGRKKPSTILDKQWLKSKAEIYTSTDRIVAEAQNGPVPSDGLKAELQSFPSIKIDWSSIKISKAGNVVQVMYKVIARTSDIDPQQTVTLWVAGWMQPPNPPEGPTLPSPPSGGDPFERLMLGALDEAKKPPPDETKKAKKSSSDETKKVAVVQLTTRTRAAFSTNPALLQQATVAR